MVEIDHLARKLIKRVMIFRQIEAASGFPSWYGYSSRSVFDPQFGYQDRKPLFEEVARSVVKLNPSMLSKFEVKRQLEMFLLKQTSSVTKSSRLNDQSLVDDAKN